MDIYGFASRMVVAMAAGFLIGFERQWRHKSAGLRTHMLVAFGSALYVVLSVQLTRTGGDVTRIIGQVITGIGFLGGGIIFKEGLNIHGLTTAATIWCSSAVGCLAAAGFYFESIAGTAGVLFINMTLVPLDAWLSDKNTKSDE